jgi:hypothetical protein
MIPGVDAPLPEGEHLLWSGAPSVAVQLRRGAVLPLAGTWLVLAASLPMILGDGGTGPTLAHLTWVLVIGLFLVASAAGLAWLVSRTTTYAVTDRRVVLRIGIALPAVLNIPLSSLAGANARRHRDGSGDIDLPLADGQDHPGYALLWPHARPWRWGRPEPSLRWLADVSAAAEALRDAARSRPDRFRETVGAAPT